MALYEGQLSTSFGGFRYGIRPYILLFLLKGHQNNYYYYVLFKVKLLVTSRTEIQQFSNLQEMPLDNLDLKQFPYEDAVKLLRKTVRPVSIHITKSQRVVRHSTFKSRTTDETKTNIKMSEKTPSFYFIFLCLIPLLFCTCVCFLLF